MDEVGQNIVICQWWTDYEYTCNNYMPKPKDKANKWSARETLINHVVSSSQMKKK